MTLPDLNVYIYVSTTITSLHKTALQFLLPALNNENLQVLTSLVLFLKLDYWKTRPSLSLSAELAHGLVNMV